MYANSRTVSTAQTSIHAHLQRLVTRHSCSVFQRPIADYNRRAFDASMATWRGASAPPLILDAGCGTGWSTHHLALQFPGHFVIGVDQSADRLARGTRGLPTAPSNLLLVRANLIDYWRLLHAAGVQLSRHYVLYPNPWPKIGQLARRWHAHPVFPTVVALGGKFECRSNWPVYIAECAAALSQLTGTAVAAEPYAPTTALTPFEKKYLASGHAVVRCRTTLRRSPSAL